MRRFLNPDVRRTVFFIVGITLSAAVVTEVVIRLFSLAPPLRASSEYANERLQRYRPGPRSVINVKTAEFSYMRRHNSLGFRDVEHAVPKPAGVFRIVALGDDFTYGTGVDSEQSYLSRLETLLNERAGPHPRVEIVKTGIPGFFPEPERVLLQHEGMRFAPDLVLTAFLPNDVIDTYRGLGALLGDEWGYLMTRDAQQLGSGMQFFIRFSAAARLVASHQVERLIARESPDRDDDLYIAGGFHEPDWKTVEAEYARMKAIADSGQARFALVHIPQAGRWDARSAYPANRLSRWSREHGAIFIDVLPVMEAARSETLYYPRDGHCTAEGYEVIARTLFTRLTESGVVP